jgi:hypothetical protein
MNRVRKAAEREREHIASLLRTYDQAEFTEVERIALTLPGLDEEEVKALLLYVEGFKLSVLLTGIPDASLHAAFILGFRTKEIMYEEAMDIGS